MTYMYLVAVTIKREGKDPCAVYVNSRDFLGLCELEDIETAVYKYLKDIDGKVVVDHAYQLTKEEYDNIFMNRPIITFNKK